MKAKGNSMKIENSITIQRSIDSVFDITNDIASWTNLFTEYQESKVLEKKDNYIKFSLTTKPEKKEKSRSWISERFIDRKNWSIRAKRIDPVYPFKCMDIYWYYKSTDAGTEMTWVQEFTMDPQSGYKDELVAANMNRNTKVQMAAIKSAIEGGQKYAANS